MTGFFFFFTSGSDGLDEEETDKHQNEDRRLHFPSSLSFVGVVFGVLFFCCSTDEIFLLWRGGDTLEY